jgi:hypothetical protein
MIMVEKTEVLIETSYRVPTVVYHKRHDDLDTVHNLRLKRRPFQTGSFSVFMWKRGRQN